MSQPEKMNCLRRPCILPGQDEIKTFCRRRHKHDYCMVSIQNAQWFHRRRLKYENFLVQTAEQTTNAK